MKTLSRISRVAAAAVLAGALSFAAEFSADFVDVKGPQTSSGKLYMKDTKVRREVTQGRPSITISRPDKEVMWILNPANKTYFEMPNVGKEAANMDVNEALKGLGERKLVGEETVNGYPCDKYVFVYNDKSMGTLNQWISKKLKIAIKMESEGSPYKMVTEYKNIKEGPIADSIFDLPAGYTKINLPGRR